MQPCLVREAGPTAIRRLPSAGTEMTFKVNAVASINIESFTFTKQ